MQNSHRLNMKYKRCVDALFMIWYDITPPPPFIHLSSSQRYIIYSIEISKLHRSHPIFDTRPWGELDLLCDYFTTAITPPGHFSDDIFKCISLNENVWISLKISMKYVIMVQQATSHYLNQWWLVYWRIYAQLGLNGVKGLGYTQTQRWIQKELCIFLITDQTFS